MQASTVPLTGPNPVLVAFRGTEPQSRITAFFRLILLIPHFIVLYFLRIAAFVILIIGWFGALFTGRLPDFAADFLAGVLRWELRVSAYLFLLNDRYPPFTLEPVEDYPARLAVAPGPLNRLAVLFRLFLAIPAEVVAGIAVIGMFLVSIVGWVITVITGRLPRALHEAFSAVLRFEIRYWGYWYLLTSSYPSGLFGDQESAEGGWMAEPQPAWGPGQAPYGGGPGTAWPPASPPPPTGPAPSPEGWAPSDQPSPPAPASPGAPSAANLAGEQSQTTDSPPSTTVDAPTGVPSMGHAPQSPWAASKPGQEGGAGAWQPAPGTPGAPPPPPPGAPPAPPPGFPAPTAPPVGRATPWPLVLSKSAKRLVALFLILGVLTYVGIVVGSTVAGSSSSSARTQVLNYYNSLGRSLNSAESQERACVQSTGNDFQCAKTFDRQAAQQLSTYASQIRGVSVPSSSSQAAAEVVNSSNRAAGLLTNLANSPTRSVYASRLNQGGGIQESLNAVDSSTTNLITSLL